MSELVLRSMYAPKDHIITIDSRSSTKFRVNMITPDNEVGVTISHEDARKLRDFLNKELGEQAPEPMDSEPWVYLERSSDDNDFWVQFPTEQRARDYAMKRIRFKITHQMLARCHQTLVPVTVTTTSYEWKDIV